MLLDLWAAVTVLACTACTSCSLCSVKLHAAELPCTLQTSEAERIGVNQVAKVHPTGNPSGTEQRECLCPSLLATAGLQFTSAWWLCPCLLIPGEILWLRWAAWPAAMPVCKSPELCPA